MSQGEDLDAVDRFFQRQTPKSAEGRAEKASWRSWFDGLGFWSKCCDSDTWKEAQTRRDRYNHYEGGTLEERGFTPVEKRPEIDVEKEFAGGGKPPTIARGSHMKAAIKKWQSILKNAKVYTGDIDGGFGGMTEASTKTFQAKHGLPQTGVVDEATWAAGGVKSVSDITPPPKGFGKAPVPGTKPVAKPPAGMAFRKPKEGFKSQVVPKESAAMVLRADTLGHMPNWLKWVLGLIVGAGVVVAGAVGLSAKKDEDERRHRYT